MLAIRRGTLRSMWHRFGGCQRGLMVPHYCARKCSTQAEHIKDVVDSSELAQIRNREIPMWAAYGFTFNSALLFSADFLDVFVAAEIGLSAISATGMASCVVGCGGLVALLTLPGVFAMPNQALQPKMFSSKRVGRSIGLLLGALLGLFPLMWPEEWRLWAKGIASQKQARTIELTGIDKKIQQNALLHFPLSATSQQLEGKVFSVLQSRGWTLQNTLFAHSTCPDEVNYNQDTDLVNLMSDRWGKRFTLGGLAGMAFAGKTGWGAFGAHTPESGGRIIVLYGPHVGIGNDNSMDCINDGQAVANTVGCLNRAGQAYASTCCGAAVAAYKCKSIAEDDWTVDMQQIALTKLLWPYRQAIADDDNPMKALAYANFEVSHDYLTRQISAPGRVCDEIAVFGGIIVNVPGNCEDRFVPMTFELLNCKTGEIKDLFAHLNIDRPSNRFGTKELRKPFFFDHSNAIQGKAD